MCLGVNIYFLKYFLPQETFSNSIYKCKKYSTIKILKNTGNVIF